MVGSGDHGAGVSSFPEFPAYPGHTSISGGSGVDFASIWLGSMNEESSKHRSSSQRSARSHSQRSTGGQESSRSVAHQVSARSATPVEPVASATQGSPRTLVVPANNTCPNCHGCGTKERELPEDFYTDANFEKLHHMLATSEQADKSNFAASAVADLAKMHYPELMEVRYEVRQPPEFLPHDFILQWKLLRNQTGMLSQQLLNMQKQIEGLTKTSQTHGNRLDAQGREVEAAENRIKSFVRQLFERLENGISRLRHDHEAHVERRDSSDVNVHKRIDFIAEQVGKAFDKNGVPLDSEVRKLRAEFQAYQAQASALKEFMQRAADDMKIGWDQMLEHHAKVKSAVEIESQQRAKSYDDLHRTVRNLVEKERSERDINHAKFGTHVEALMKDVTTHRDMIPLLRKKVEDLEYKLVGSPIASETQLEAKLSGPLERIKEIERRFDHVQACLNQESMARQALSEVFEQMLKTERTKITNLVTQKTAFARLDCEEMTKGIQEKVEKEIADREALAAEFQTALVRIKDSFTDRIMGIEGFGTGYDQKFVSLVAEVRELSALHRKLEDGVVACMRDTKRELTAAIEEEAQLRQQADHLIDEQLGYLGDVHDHIRQLHMQKGARKVALAGSVPLHLHGGTSPRNAEINMTP